MRREIIVLLTVFMAGFALAAEKPNILIIMADDHGKNAISCYGSPLINTPSIDRLAREGMRFTGMCTSNSLCSPCRAILLSGKYSHMNSVRTNRDPFDFNQSNFAGQLQKAGYETSIIGKWHLMSEPWDFDYYNVIPAQGQYFNCRFKEKGQVWENGRHGGIVVPGYLSDVITDKSLEWLSNKRDNDKPFCLLIHHKAPHSPHHPAKRHADLFKDIELPEPATLYNDLENKAIQEIQDSMISSRLAVCRMPQFQEFVQKNKGKREEGTREMFQEFFKGYLSLVASLDENIGRVLDYLDETNLTENTIVIYLSDNGFFTGEFGLYNKMLMYEPSMKIPFIVRYPGNIAPGAVNTALCSLIDVAPTLLDFGQASIPDDMQGLSLRQVLSDNKKHHHRSVYYHYYARFFLPEMVGLRTERYKLIHYLDPDLKISWELYDLKKDPEELQNIVNQRTGIFRKLKKELLVQKDKYGDPISLDL